MAGSVFRGISTATGTFPSLVHQGLELFILPGVVSALTSYLLVQFCYCPDRLRAAFAEDHFGAGTDVLRRLYEAEPTRCFVTCPQMLFIHAYDGRRLPQATTMYCLCVRKNITEYTNITEI